MSDLTPTRLYVEAQIALESMTQHLKSRLVEMREDDEAGWEMPAQMIVMVALVGVAIALAANFTRFGQEVMSKLRLP